LAHFGWKKDRKIWEEALLEKKEKETDAEPTDAKAEKAEDAESKDEEPRFEGYEAKP
jgi:hypothetical protein